MRADFIRSMRADFLKSMRAARSMRADFIRSMRAARSMRSDFLRSMRADFIRSMCAFCIINALDKKFAWRFVKKHPCTFYN
jgi:hypothetical protein